jgi:hypothetical protein
MARRVFFVIEGCIKADAVLSAGEAVFSVPSVTLWPPGELRQYAGFLRKKAIYIVPDADWRTNPMVMLQALLCRSFLRKLGLDAHVAAPPADAYRHNKELKGVDDHLAHGGTMADLDVLRREARFGLAEWLAERGKMRKDKIVRAAEALNSIALHADQEGVFRAPLSTTARVMDMGARRVQRGVHDLAELGAVSVEGSIETRVCWFSKGLKWRKPPSITVHPDLRATDILHKLGDT